MSINAWIETLENVDTCGKRVTYTGEGYTVVISDLALTLVTDRLNLTIQMTEDTFTNRLAYRLVGSIIAGGVYSA